MVISRISTGIYMRISHKPIGKLLLKKVYGTVKLENIIPGMGNEIQNSPIIVHDEPIIFPTFVTGTNSLYPIVFIVNNAQYADIGIDLNGVFGKSDSAWY